MKGDVSSFITSSLRALWCKPGAPFFFNGAAMANGTPNGNGSWTKVAMGLIGLVAAVVTANASLLDKATQEMREHYVTKAAMEQRWAEQERRWSAQDRKLDRIESKLEALSVLLKRLRS